MSEVASIDIDITAGPWPLKLAASEANIDARSFVIGEVSQTQSVAETAENPSLSWPFPNIGFDSIRPTGRFANFALEQLAKPLDSFRIRVNSPANFECVCWVLESRPFASPRRFRSNVELTSSAHELFGGRTRAAQEPRGACLPRQFLPNLRDLHSALCFKPALCNLSTLDKLPGRWPLLAGNLDVEHVVNGSLLAFEAFTQPWATFRKLLFNGGVLRRLPLLIQENVDVSGLANWIVDLGSHCRRPLNCRSNIFKRIGDLSFCRVWNGSGFADNFLCRFKL